MDWRKMKPLFVFAKEMTLNISTSATVYPIKQQFEYNTH